MMLFASMSQVSISAISALSLSEGTGFRPSGTPQNQIIVPRLRRTVDVKNQLRFDSVNATECIGVIKAQKNCLWI